MVCGVQTQRRQLQTDALIFLGAVDQVMGRTTVALLPAAGAPQALLAPRMSSGLTAEISKAQCLDLSTGSARFASTGLARRHPCALCGKVLKLADIFLAPKSLKNFSSK